MDKDKYQKDNDQSGGITDKKDSNAGSGAFNQGSEQDPNYNKGTKISDEEKRTGEPPSSLGHQAADPQDGHLHNDNQGSPD